MKPLWKLPSGQFAGWLDEKNLRVYNSDGTNVGITLGNVIYYLSGLYIGEFCNNDWVGRKRGVSYPLQGSISPFVGIAMSPYSNRVGISLSGWDEPDF